MVSFIRENYYARLWLSVIVLIVSGILFLYFAQIFNLSTFWSATVSNVASALIITGVFSIINEYLLKDKLVELILSKLKLKDSIDRTGITEIFSSINEIDYRFLIKHSRRNIDILHIYARTWTNNNFDELKDKMQRSNVKIRVVLLSPESKLLEGLAEHYQITHEDLKDRIKEMESKWEELVKLNRRQVRKKTQSSIKLYYSDYLPAYSIYKFDNQLVNVQSKPSREKTGKLPSIIVRDTLKENDLFDMYSKQFEDVLKQGTEVTFN
ncbi:hypothetical protein [Rossellomorea arthrocnemi]|uniref:hypothetical protein n=1 Tax=Rossellomorea arthrocnemi TaxID=2769542 RepID=UPI001919C3D1|nr:hypothetical protein [Rossellomorea arthrocnemi]